MALAARLNLPDLQNRVITRLKDVYKRVHNHRLVPGSPRAVGIATALCFDLDLALAFQQLWNGMRHLQELGMWRVLREIEDEAQRLSNDPIRHHLKRFMVQARNNEQCRVPTVDPPARSPGPPAQPVTIRSISQAGDIFLRTHQQIECLTRALKYIIPGFGQSESQDRERRRDPFFRSAVLFCQVTIQD